MKLFSILVLAGVSLLSFAAISPADKTSLSKVVIGVSLPGTDHSWLGAIKRNIETAAKSHSNVELVVTDAMNSSEKQMENVETLIRKKPSVIIMLPNSGKALTPAAKKIREAGIPLVVLDRMIESEDYAAYIGGDNYGIGQAAARYIGTALKGEGTVAEVMGLPGISVTTDRSQGFKETLKNEFPKIQLVASLAADFNASKAIGVTENLLQAHPKLNAIYSHDDDMNVGVLQAIKQKGKEGQILLTGAGGSKLMMDNIKAQNTAVKATFLYNPSMAGSALNMAYLIATKGKMTELWEMDVPRKVVVRASTVTKDNVSNYASLGY